MDDKVPDLVRAQVEPRWDELRERRVLDAVLSKTRTRAPLRWPLALGATLAVAGAVLLIVFSVTRRTDKSSSLSEDHALLDGSLLTYAADADVQVLEQQDATVALRQTKGRVRYQVKHNPDRRFSVKVGAVEVLVVGTVFVVDARGSQVNVHVDHGRVQVHDGSREVDLSDGEEVQMSTTPPVEIAAPETLPVPVEPNENPRPAPDSALAVQRLLAQADKARSSGNFAEAVTTLSTVVNRYPKDPRAVSAWFTLGRVEGQLGRHADAARAFESCRARAPRGPLAEDALAEEAASWQKAGQADRAHAAARKYLDLYPAGAHAARMRPFAE